FCGTPKVKIDPIGSQFHRAKSVLRYRLGFSTEELKINRSAGARAAPLSEFGRISIKHMGRHQQIRHTHKFGDTSIEAADSGEAIAQNRVDHALHRSEPNLHSVQPPCSPAIMRISAYSLTVTGWTE